jgi:hypothetical protein
VGIWREWVVDPSQASQLQQRSTALTAYAAAQSAAGDWDLPPEIRRSLDTWQFDQTTAFIDQARDVLAQRDQIAADAANEQTSSPPTLRTAFERSGLIVASTEATNELAVLDELSAASQARTAGGAAAPLGLLGVDPQTDLASARDAFAKGDLGKAMSLATSARTAWQGADTAGQIRILGSLCVLGGVLLLLALFIWTRGYRRRRQTALA